MKNELQFKVGQLNVDRTVASWMIRLNKGEWREVNPHQWDAAIETANLLKIGVVDFDVRERLARERAQGVEI